MLMRIPIVILFCFLGTIANAQKGKVIDAINSLATNNLKQAKLYIDEAMEDPALTEDPQTWYWKGFIYKEIYKLNDKGKNPESKLRIESADALREVLNRKTKVAEDTVQSAMKMLKFLASTYYNDAANFLDTSSYDVAKDNYASYRELTTLVNPEGDLRESDIKFKMKLATVYVSLYEARSSSSQGDVFFDQAVEEYSEVIEMDKNHLSANYNLGIQYYNKAVKIIQNLDVDTPLDELRRKEDQCVELFLKALPYVLTAYKLDPNRKETLIGLTGIYWSLNDLEKYQHYKDELAKLNQE